MVEVWLRARPTTTQVWTLDGTRTPTSAPSMSIRYCDTDLSESVVSVGQVILASGPRASTVSVEPDGNVGWQATSTPTSTTAAPRTPTFFEPRIDPAPPTGPPTGPIAGTFFLNPDTEAT